MAAERRDRAAINVNFAARRVVPSATGDEKWISMTWLFFAFSGPVLWAISTHLDKYLVEKYFKHSDVAVLLFFTACIGALTLPFIAWYEPTVFQLDAGSIALIIVSGILYMGAMLLYLHALQSEDATVVAPFFQSVPLFGYVLAYVFLGERLSAMQMAGGALIVAGTLIVSVRFGETVRRFKLRLVLLMLACGLAAALSGLIFKIFAIDVAFWTTTFWMFVGEAIFGVALLAIPAYRRGLAAVLRTNTTALLTINGSNELINLGGGLGNRYALMFAPLSIVQAISSTTTLFVFAFGIALGVLFPQLSHETLSARDLVQKGAAAIFVALGVGLATH
jgi:drug/metabolite transporter (DMT)-like permease